MNNVYIVDIEADGLLDDVTKIHCLSYTESGSGVVTTLTDYQDIKDFMLDNTKIKAGHNIIRYDIPVIEKILGIKIPQGMIIDTLSFSWYLFMDEKKHGLEEWGERFGIKKPIITDWSTQTVGDYIHRCEEDVKINDKLWIKQLRYLTALYDDPKDITRLIKYFQFKMECMKEQQELGLKLDVTHVKNILKQLEIEKENKIKELTSIMPKIPIKETKAPPKVMYKKDKTLSSAGSKWLDLCLEHDLNVTTGGEYIKAYKEPNPNSHEQIKNWLYSLGWVPEHYKYKRDKKTNAITKIPQITEKVIAGAGSGNLCPSVKKLYDKEPKLDVLEGLSVLNHRIALFKSFLEEEKNGRLYADMRGLTNTLRLQHAVIVNLPAIDKKYGYDIRRSIVSDNGYVLCGADLSNIEDRTKRHYIYPYDPEYVRTMDTPGYDAHLEIGKLAGLLDDNQIELYKNYDESKDKSKSGEYKEIKAIRNKAKIVNFSATYKIGVEALARNSNMATSEARKLLNIYWERNKAIREIENSLSIKGLAGKRWLKNPISGFWYSLRSDKDKFSTLNQGSAVYVFDIWLTYMRKLGLKIAFQYHDEMLLNVKKGHENIVTKKIKEAMRLTNEKLKLNIQVDCGIQWGGNYAECH
jgi:DNA polymerase I-like protein with 3'-5' exonuclease and polymerase domains